MPPPNILWICSDQQRWDTLGCYGNGWVHTPHLDRLAAGGTVFETAVCQSPVCTPSRASFLTGRYPRTTRCRQNGQAIPADERLVTRLLADGGYTCGLAGKLHLSPCHPSVCPTVEPRIDDGYAEFHWSHHAAGGWGQHNAYWAWLAERGASYQTPRHPDCAHLQTGMPEALHQTRWCCDTAADFVQRHADADTGRPWLFSINMFDPHHAFDPPPNYLARYAARLDEIPLPRFTEGELADRPPYQQQDHRGAYNGHCGLPYDRMSETDHRWVRAAYWAMCDHIDAEVGRLLATLEARGQLANTLVIYMSDHGELLGDHGMYLKGPHFYEEGVRVPLIVSWPGQVQARRSSALVELTDLAPTLLEAAGLPAAPGMQGRSLWPLLTGADDGAEAGAPPQQRDAAHRADLYSEYYNAMSWHREPHAHVTMLRTATHKLVVDHSHPGTGELYDLAADPGEHHNLWHDPAALPLKADLLLRLTHRMAFTVDPLPERTALW